MGISSEESVTVKRLTASSANLQSGVTIGGSSFSSSCDPTGTQNVETTAVNDESIVVNVAESEAVIVFL